MRGSSSPVAPAWRLSGGYTVAGQIVTIALLAAYALTYAAFSDPFDAGSRGADFAAYWNAASRIRDGLALYPPLADQQANDVYRYSAWFAVALVPLTYLPRVAVETAWIGASFVASGYLLWSVLRVRTPAAIALGLLLGPWLVENAWVGQIQTTLVALLSLTLNRTAGPIAVGVAASLKLTPLAFAAWYGIQRQWGRAAVSVGVFLLLALPTLLFDLKHYPTEASEMGFVGAPLWLWAIVVLGVIATSLFVASRVPRLRLLAVCVISMVAAPRVHHVSATYLLPALAPEPPRRQQPP